MYNLLTHDPSPTDPFVQYLGECGYPGFVPGVSWRRSVFLPPVFISRITLEAWSEQTYLRGTWIPTSVGRYNDNIPLSVDSNGHFSALLFSPDAKSKRWSRWFHPHSLLARCVISLFLTKRLSHFIWRMQGSAAQTLLFDCVAIDEQLQTKISCWHASVVVGLSFVAGTNCFSCRRQCSHGCSIFAIRPIKWIIADIFILCKWEEGLFENIEWNDVSCPSYSC